MSNSLKDAPVSADKPCSFCKHYYKRMTCAAFPPTKNKQTDTIPDEIEDGLNQHKKIHPDQKNDIVFEPIEK